jgi:hypothetical protein
MSQGGSRKKKAEAPEETKAQAEAAPVQQEKLNVVFGEAHYVKNMKPWTYERIAIREDGYYEIQVQFEGSKWYCFQSGYLKDVELKEEG